MKKLFLILLLLTVPVLIVPVSAANLDTLGDLRQALMDNLGLSSATNFWTEGKLDRLINRSVKFVETATRDNQQTLEFSIVPSTYSWDLGDTVSQNAVVSAYIIYAKGEKRQQGLVYRPRNEFGKGSFDKPEAYYLWDNKIYVEGTVAQYGVLYVDVFKVSADLVNNGDSLLISKGAKRELILAYAYYLALQAENRLDRAQGEFQAWLTKYQIIMGLELKQPEPFGFKELVP